MGIHITQNGVDMNIINKVLITVLLLVYITLNICGLLSAFLERDIFEYKPALWSYILPGYKIGHWLSQPIERN